MITKGFAVNSSGNISRYPRVRFATISDGSSNTVMYIEKSAFSQNYSGVTGDWSTVVGESYGALGVGNFNVVRSISAPIADGDTLNETRLPSSGESFEQSVGSAHPGTTNMVLADGSTHSASNNASLASLWALQDRADGVVLGVDEL